jgi:hypothetical protein
MSLVKTQKKTVLQRVRNLILGQEKPNFFTRISVTTGFIIWIYLFSWQVLSFIAFMLMGSLKQAKLVEGSFSRVGQKLYDIPNILNRLLIHSFAEFVAFGLVLLGLILIWRKRKLGFVIYVVGNLSILLSTLFILGREYLFSEVSSFDIILILASSAYFGIGIWWFYKRKDTDEEEKKEFR